jgi:glycosyltransferase involved in cell wall biosynthesis
MIAEEEKNQNQGCPIRVVFLWAEISGYMASCWRALARQPGLQLHVIHPERLWGKKNPFLQVPGLMDGISNEMFCSQQPDLDRWLREHVASREPDVVVMCGWFFGPYNRLVTSGHLGKAKVILGMDSPWRGTWKQRLTWLRIRKLVQRVDLVVTTGERSWEYARRAGFAEKRIRLGFYGFDESLFKEARSKRLQPGHSWPRRFLFTGRYVAQKDLPTLTAAYSVYRKSVDSPWELTCCGSGEGETVIRGVEGVTDAGFTLPQCLPEVFAEHGVFILPSRFEPWGVVIAEACASGLPVICTTACGAGMDLIRPYYNGLLVTPGNVSSLAAAMKWMHDHESTLAVMGQRGAAMADAYSAETWAVRWSHYFQELLTGVAERH